MTKDTSGSELREYFNKNGGMSFRLPDIEKITKREYIAISAMQGMLTGTLGRFNENSQEVASPYRYGPCNAAIAERAYVIADAMILEGGKK